MKIIGRMCASARNAARRMKMILWAMCVCLVRCTRKKEFDVAIIFSQDQGLSEAVIEVKEIAKEQGRSIRIVSAFPESAIASSPRGVEKTDWFPFDESFYDACVDPRDYRPAKFQSKTS